MSTRLLTPRGYLSWSQVNLWLHNPERYICEYVHGERMDLSTPFMEFGKRMATARELRDTGGDEELHAAISLVPQFEIREHEIRETLRTKDWHVDLLGRLDSFDPKTLSFRDDKTGATRWTQRRAEGHNQLLHYAALVYLKHGRVPKEAWIDWIETEIGDTDGLVHITGHVESFRVPLSLSGVLEYMALAMRVAREIDEAYRKELDKLT